MNTEKYRELYKNELLNQVIPFWEKHCIDHENGGFFTMLDRDGSVYDTEKYMWMQWRIVYMFAELCKSEFAQNRWLKIAENGFDYLSKHGKSENGTYYFALNGKGEASMAPYSIYSNCFAVMGAAALYRCTGKETHKAEAESAMQSYLSMIDAPKGRWNKAMPGKKKMLSLGHYMMLANMGLIMKNSLKTDKYDKDVINAVELVLARFHNKQFGILFENISTDYQFDLDSSEGRHITPGHGLESLWFIMLIGKTYQRPDFIERALPIIENILNFGWDKEFGGLFYFMDVLGKPHIELQWNMKLWWVHCEALIAVLMAYNLSGKKVFADWFEKLHEYTWTHFKDKEFPEWFAYLDRQGNPTSYMKGGKWKSFFHLPRMLLFVHNILKSLPSK